MLITFDRVVRSSISFPHWKGLLNTFLTMCYLSGLVVKTTLLYYVRIFIKIVLCIMDMFWSTSPNFIIFNGDLWNHEPVQLKPTEFKSVQPVLRKSGAITHTYTHTHSHTHRHVFVFWSWVDMYTWRYTWGAYLKSSFFQWFYSLSSVRKAKNGGMFSKSGTLC